MSSQNFRNQIKSKQTKLKEARKKHAAESLKASQNRKDSAKAKQLAARSKGNAIQKTKLKEADRKEEKALKASVEAAKIQAKISTLENEIQSLEHKLAQAIAKDDKEVERKLKRDQDRADKEAARQQASLNNRLFRAESSLEQMRQLPEPKQEKLRILILGAAPNQDLRVGREQQRIRSAVQAATHRDYIEIESYPAATTENLLDGISRFRPHVVHFSGHGNVGIIVFDEDQDVLEPTGNHGVPVKASAFANVISATDDPPLLVLLNSCNSASQADDLVEEVVPFAIGMASSIDDRDAIRFAARFYASIAEGQSIHSSYRVAKSDLELSGANGADLPTLSCSSDVDPSVIKLVQGPTK